MTTALINGITIRYDASGSGPAVLLTHGYSSTGRAWEDQHRALGDGYRVISWDMRGHGETDSPGDPALYSHDLTVADMHGLLRHLGVERAIVGGLSGAAPCRWPSTGAIPRWCERWSSATPGRVTAMPTPAPSGTA